MGKTGAIVVALGGNALLQPGDRGTRAEQLARAEQVAEGIVALDAPGGLVVTHGNGPQVGLHLLRSDLLSHDLPAVPIDVAVAATQGEIGLILGTALTNRLAACGDPRAVVTVLTQVVVDPRDPSFQRPTKFVGRFYTREDAEARAAELGWRIAQDADRGWRRVVPSPAPFEVIELGAIKTLLASGAIVIAGGGGGVPVIRVGRRLVGAEAVVDKDHTAALIAAGIGASALLILTAVDRVWVDYGTARARPLDVVSARDARGWLADGQFPAGSMGPKVEAAVRFVTGTGGRAVITSPEQLAGLAHGAPHTVIVP